MAEIIPFKGIRYNQKKVELTRVVAPPYDVISPAMQDNLYNRDKHNIIRLILGKEKAKDSEINNKYVRARQYLDSWLRDKILAEDQKEALYVYEQEYLHRGIKKKRIGFIALLKIEDPKKSQVLPHEFTMAKPKEDRLKLIRATEANLCPIFSLFEDDNSKITKILKIHTKERPIINIQFDGVLQKVWCITNTADIAKIQKFMKEKQIFIADGHHRYEVALAYRDERRKKAPKSERTSYDYAMIYFSSLDEEALTILSTHRLIKDMGALSGGDVIKKLQPYFDIQEFKTKEAMFSALEQNEKKCFCFGIYLGANKFCLLHLKDENVFDKIVKLKDRSTHWKRLDATVLHLFILEKLLDVKGCINDEENIVYTRDADGAIKSIDEGRCKAAFFMNPPKVAQVKNVAQTGERMWQKSTYFYPKLLSGLVINKF